MQQHILPILGCTTGTALRYVLAQADWTNQVELSTPVSNFNRLREGLYLSRFMDPYDGGTFFQSPLLLALRFLGLESDTAAATTLWIALDIATGLAVSEIAHLRGWSRSRGLLLWLLHPFALLTCVSRSTLVFTNLCIVTSVLLYMKGTRLVVLGSAPASWVRRLAQSAFLLSIATCLSLPSSLTMLVMAVSMYKGTNSMRPSVVYLCMFAAHHTVVQGILYSLFGKTFIRNVYGTQVLFEDLAPTLGLWWYFFIEIFDPFRLFFIGIFHLLTLVHQIPLAYVYGDDPLFSLSLCYGVTTLLKAYPSLGDYAVWHVLMALALDKDTLDLLRYPLLSLGLTMYSLVLLPSFHYLWLYAGTGNSNFFYASTLVWAISQGSILLDIATAVSRKKALRMLAPEQQERIARGDADLARVAL